MYNRWLLLFLLGICPLLSQSQGTTGASNRYRLYNEASGLGRHTILDIARDENGFYWLATEKGIVRFDGANFTEINPPEPYTNERVRSLYVYGKWLYLMYLREGCVRLNLENYTFETITNLTVTGVIHLNEQRLVIMDNDGNLYARERDKLILRHAFQATNDHHPMFLQDSLLFVHVFGKGMQALDAKTLKIRANLGFPSLHFQLSFSRYPNELFFLGDLKMHRLTKDLQMEPVANLSNIQHDLSYIQHDLSGAQYLIDRNKMLFKVRNGIATLIPLSGLENVELRKFIIHDSSNIIVATNVGLLHVRTGFSPIEQFSDNQFVTYKELRIRRKILPVGPDDLIMIGHPFNVRYTKGKLNTLSTMKVSAYDAVQIGKDIYYTTENNGLFRYHLDRSTQEKIQLKNQWATQGMYAIVFNPHDSLLVIGGFKGLYVKPFQNKKEQLIALPSPFTFIQTIMYDTLRRRYWVGTDNGLICLDNRFRPIHLIPKLRDGSRPMDVTELMLHSKSGNLWIAHRFGVEVIDPESFQPILQLKNTFFKNPIVASLVEDNNGNVWMSTFEEIMAYKPLNRSFLRLGTKNNLSNQEYNFKSFAKLPDGRLIFGGVTGYDIIDPKAFSFNRSSDIGILTGYDLITKEKTILKAVPKTDEKISFDIDSESLRLYLSARNQLNSRNYTYEYKFNNDGWNTMKDASYLNIYKLDPGRYTLQFRAFDEYGSLITFKPIEINATVVFYKNRYFIWSLFLLTIALIVLVVLNEIRRKYRENQLKEQISMDLHDEVGTILTRALMTAQSTGISQKDERLSSYLSEALYSLRVYINTMNKSTFSLYQLADELREMIHQTFAHTSFEVNPDIHIQSEKLISSEKYRDMKLCLYEILNNILKHAHASTIDIRMDDTSQHVRFIIKDNGLLTQIDKLDNKGNGVRNIRKRLKKHGGIASFTLSENGHGLLVSMICPL